MSLRDAASPLIAGGSPTTTTVTSAAFAAATASGMPPVSSPSASTPRAYVTFAPGAARRTASRTVTEGYFFTASGNDQVPRRSSESPNGPTTARDRTDGFSGSALPLLPGWPLPAG